MSKTNVSSLPAPPLTNAKSRLAAELVSGLDAHALHWLSGYMAGAAAQHGILSASKPSVISAQQTDARLTILYGSQTGNAKRVAEQLAHKAEQAGLAVQLIRADAYKPRQLASEQLLYVIISTHSEGDKVEPPDDARGLIEFLHSKRAPKLQQLSYAVLGLGDTSYPEFCVIGRRVDERLHALGAQRLFAYGEADVDIDSVAEPWSASALEHAHKALNTQTAAINHAPLISVVTPLHPLTQNVSRQHPYAAEVLVNQRIVANDSGKDVRHIELSLEGSGLTYQPGDALGVWPRQAAALVTAVLDILGLEGTAPVEHAGDRLPLSQWLTERVELTSLTRPFLVAHAERGQHDELSALLAPEARSALTTLFATHQLIDVLRRWPVTWTAEALVAALRPLAPRMYSIASSQTVVGNEVHLTVAHVHYTYADEPRWGAASRHLCGLDEGDTVSVFIDSNDRFRLPTDHHRDIIMIGPGTGVAPFRAFVQEREASAAMGRQWLFFGNPHRRTDFLYQLEWQQALRDGALTKLSVAFSRDQEHKHYVQHRLREHGHALWAWLDGGAHVYVCGDATRMSADVHTALIDVVAEHAGKSQDDADAWLQQRMREGRYVRDVY